MVTLEHPKMTRLQFKWCKVLDIKVLDKKECVDKITRGWGNEQEIRWDEKWIRGWTIFWCSCYGHQNIGQKGMRGCDYKGWGDKQEITWETKWIKGWTKLVERMSREAQED